MAARPTINSLALLSLIFGLTSVALVYSYLSIPLNLVGVVTGLIGLQQINDRPEGQSGRQRASAGSVLSMLAVVIRLLTVLIRLGGMALTMLGVS